MTDPSSAHCSGCQCVASVCAPASGVQQLGVRAADAHADLAPASRDVPDLGPDHCRQHRGHEPVEAADADPVGLHADELDNLRTLLAGGASVKFADMKTAIGTTCEACVFSPSGGSNRQPIVEFSNAFIQNTFGACEAHPRCDGVREGYLRVG